MALLTQFRVGTRLTASFLFLALCCAAVGTVGLINLRAMDERAERMYQEDLLGISRIKQVRIDVLQVGKFLRNVILSPDEETRTRYEGQAAKYQKLLHEHFNEARTSFDTDQGRTIMSALEEQWRDFDDKAAVVMKQAASDTSESRREASATLFGTYAETTTRIDKLVADASALMEAHSQQSASDTKAGYAGSRNAMLTLIVCAFAASLALGAAISRTITHPLAQAVGAARAVATGDLTTPIRAEGNDEVAELLRALQAMQDHLARIVVKVRENADVVASASAQIASGTADLGRRTEAQVTSLEKTASSMDRLHEIVFGSSKDAARANGLAADATAVATRSGEVVGQVVGTMQGIHDSSTRIVEIISLIDGIAFQTNILALNAAVEAARAGEQGRGFAVVASEVRSLAQRSTAAAREIKDLISESVERVGSGSVLVKQAGDTMQEVLAVIQSLSTIIAEMHAATSEENSGIGEVNKAVHLLDRSAQENSALVEQSAAATSSLTQMARELVGTVESFRLPHGA